MKGIAAALALVLCPAAQEDKIGKDKAPLVARKAVAESLKKKDAAITETSALSGIRQDVTSTYDGVLRKDFVAVKGTFEIYAKGTALLVRKGDRFDPPNALPPAEAIPVLGFKHPVALLGEASQAAPSATFLKDESLDGKECKQLSMVADAPLVKQQIKEFGDRLGASMKDATNGLISGNLSGYFDEKASTSTYLVWVGKSDLLVYKIEWAFKPVVKPGSLPPGLPSLANLMTRCEVKYSKWGEEVPFDIPGPVKSKLGVK